MDSNLSNQVVAADFSFHRKPFKMSLADGFDTYLMRWQTDGKCRAKIDGELSLVEAGDLLIFTPGQPYELRIDDEYNALGELTIESGDYHIFSRVPGLTRGGIPRNAQPKFGFHWKSVT